MAKDDYQVVVFRILKYLYQQRKKGAPVEAEMLRHDSTGRDNAYSEFVKSLHDTDAEFVKKMLKEFDKEFDQAKAAKDFRDFVAEYEAAHPLLPYEGEKET